MYNFIINKKIFYSLLTFFFFIFCFISLSDRVCAMKPACYDYKTIYDKMPSDLKSKEYLYEADGVAKIALGTYKSTGVDYRTSMKHSGDTLYYCINYTAHFTDNKGYVTNTSVYSDELRARIALAIHLGTTKWNTKANKGYTTDNFVKDYFMTQMVIHGLIYKYGGKYKEHGVDFDSISFKKDTGNLEKKTKALYKACCNAIYSDKNGCFQAAKFSFSSPKDNKLLINADGSLLLSKEVDCKIDTNNGEVIEFDRTSKLVNSANEIVLTDIIESTGDKYDSAFSFKIPTTALDNLSPGTYTATIEQANAFDRVIAKEWKCTDKNFEDNQEVVGISSTNNKVSDNYSLKFVIGNLILKKSDSITGENIEDAEFHVLQFDNTIGSYTFYKNMTYDPNTQKYYSGNLYINNNNPDGKFKVIETKAGANYINDWNGHEFVIDENHINNEVYAENGQILGKLFVHKDGETFKYNNADKEIKKQETSISVPKVKFDLFAREDISFKGVLIYQKNQKILEFTTDTDGNASVNDLIPGKYYLKESSTNPLYVLDGKETDFEIKKENGTYPDIKYTFTNKLKNCSINLFKYTSDVKDKNDGSGTKIPISDCKFGLYALNDICDAAGNVIIKKDTLINEATSDSKGELSFKNLVYADYYVKELKVPSGIILNSEPIVINTAKFELIPDTTNEYAAKLHIFNSKQKYKINLLKYGEQFSDVEQHESENGTYYSYNMQYLPLSDVTYSLYNEKNEMIMTSSSDANGIISFEPLEYGNYYCVEQSAPKTHLIDNNPINIKCTSLEPKDSVSGIITVEQSVNDNMYACSVKIKKTGEKVFVDKKKLSYNFIPLAGVVYGLYQNFDYNFPSGAILPQNTCVGYIVTDSNGLGEFDGKLPEGSYYLRELKTLKGYDLDETLHQFEIKADNNSNIEIDLSTDPFKNYLSKAGVKIVKFDANSGKKLKGVEFTLYNQNKQEIGRYKTDKRGEISIEDLPYGNYYFLETKSLKGYYSSNNQYRFTLNSDEDKLLEITNTPILKLGFEEHYKTYFVIICLLIIGVLLYLYRNEFKKFRKNKSI